MSKEKEFASFRDEAHAWGCSRTLIFFGNTRSPFLSTGRAEGCAAAGTTAGGGATAPTATDAGVAALAGPAPALASGVGLTHVSMPLRALVRSPDVSPFPSLRLPIPVLDAGGPSYPPPSPEMDDIAVRLRAYWDSLVVEEASVAAASERERPSRTNLNAPVTGDEESGVCLSSSGASLSTLER